jgi:beta-N-acetylhexosaminidase
VLLLGRNIQSEKQIKNLTKSIQSNANIPLFISIDQEGGVVSRLQWNTILTTPQMSMDTPQKAYDIAVARGEILKELGINMNLAPVVEYITDSDSFMYKRVFRGTQQQVALKGESAIKGYTSVNIISVPKHYPGHSNSSPDSHYYLPIVNITPSQWNAYIYPFKYLMEKDCVDIIMAGHVLYSKIDSNISTVSKEILTERLRNDLSFDGVILSDDMEMDAIKDSGEVKKIAKESLLAGIDILIYSKETVEQNQIYEYILQSFEKGDIDMEILNEKVLRILKLKSKYGMLQSITLQLSLE